MRKLLLFTLWVTSNTLIAETIDEKRYRTSPLLTQSQVVEAINVKILAKQFKKQLNDEERMAFVETTFPSDVDFNDLPATAAGTGLSDETMDEKRYRTSPFFKNSSQFEKVKGLSDHFNNLLDDRGREQFVDAVLVDDVDFDDLPATAAGSEGEQK